MKSFLIVVACGALLSCQPNESLRDPSTARASGPQTAKTEPGVIALTPEEQKKGHMVVTPVETRAVAERVTAPGQLTVNEDRTWRLGAVAVGRIEDVLVRQGDMVQAGQALAHIHSHEVHEARSAYEEAGVELERARSAAKYAHQRWDRAKRLLDLKAGSRQDVESAESELTSAQAQIERAESEVNKEKAHLTGILRLSVPDDAAVASVPNGDLDDIPVIAPERGVVLERKAMVDKVVNIGDELFLVSDTSSLWMLAAVNESDLSKIHAGQSTSIAVRAYPNRTFRGAIFKLGEQFDATTRTLAVRISVPNPAGLLKPEMFATAALEQTTHKAAIFVPDSAIQEINGSPVVFVEESAGRFRLRPIAIGAQANGETQVTSGLSAREKILVKGSFLLKSKMLRNTIEE